MTETLPVNPYDPAPDEAALPFVPFAGRQKAFEHLYRLLTDPANTDAVVILGRRHSGKTALLHHFHPFFDESFVSVYIPLHQLPLDSEAAWLKALSRRTNVALVEQNFSLARLVDKPPTTDNTRLWFANEYLPDILGVIRRQRQLVLLLDDADELLRAIADGRLPDDTFVFLRELLDTHPQLGLVLTLDTAAEADLPRLSPLATLTGVHRLANLTPDDTMDLLRTPVSDRYMVTDEAAAAVQAATGGQPRLLQRAGQRLFQWHENTQRSPLTPDDVKQLLPGLYAASSDEFRHLWHSLNQNERLVLTAITSLLYADPLAPITTRALETWFVETDYLLDGTAINAALRSLEYRELVTGTPVRITAGLMQTWLLDNARLSQTSAGRPASGVPRAIRRWLVPAAVIVIAAVVLLVLSIISTPRDAADLTPQPTVTLAATPVER